MLIFIFEFVMFTYPSGKQVLGHQIHFQIHLRQTHLESLQGLFMFIFFHCIFIMLITVSSITVHALFATL